MELQKFINDNHNYIEKLRDNDFVVKNNKSLCIIKYNYNRTDFNEPWMKYCKGTIIDKNTYTKLTDQINKRNALASNKIDQMTRDANTEIQKHITQIAISATINILEKKLNDKEKQNLINQSVKELGSIIKY